MKYFTDIHGPQRMNHNDCGDPLTFLLAPSSGWHLGLEVKSLNNCRMDYHEIWFRHLHYLQVKLNNYGDRITFHPEVRSKLIFPIAYFSL